MSLSHNNECEQLYLKLNDLVLSVKYFHIVACVQAHQCKLICT